MVYAEIALITIVIVTGVLLRIKKHPYATGFFTLHKLSSLGAIVLAGFIFKDIFSAEERLWNGLFIIAFLGICAISLISGALHSFERTRIPIIVYLHKISSYMASAIFIFILFN